MLSPLALVTFIGICVLVHAQYLYPASLPAAVRSPYLNAYISMVGPPSQLWTQHWNLQRNLGWTGSIRVDYELYQLWGALGDVSDIVSVEVTPTRSIIHLIAGSMDVKVTFLSPIEPDDLVLQSLPFSYVYVEASSNDGETHSVELYSDISCEWISGNDANEATWNTTEIDSTTFHQCIRRHPEIAGEMKDMVEDGVVYYALSTSAASTYRIENATIAGPTFGIVGNLKNGSASTTSSAIRDSDHYVVLAHAVRLGDITNTSSPVVWGIGLVRDPAILMASTSGNSTRHSYFFTEYDTVDDAIGFFMGDFSNVQQRAIDLDERVLSDARAISEDYADLISLSARPSLAVDITVSRTSEGGFNTSDVMTFMRDNGSSRRSNPVETIYAAFPIYLYFNPSWAGSLLSPLLSYQSSSMYSHDYACPDLGANYPYIDGNSDPGASRAIEDSGNMLIMGWSHARFSGDISMLHEYYSTYKSFADFLINNDVVTPNEFEDADGLKTANMTNLALKGIIGIKAMSEIASAVGNGADANLYSSQADESIREWKSLATPEGHLVSTYNDRTSWALIYNLFADKLLGTRLIDDSIYAAQDTFYANQAQIAQSFGLPYDSSANNEVKSHWTMFTAAAASDAQVRDTLISMVHTKAASNESVGVFPSTYNATDGSSISGAASPAQGAMFAILSLNLKSKLSATDTDPNGSDSPSPRNVTGVIVGGVVGGLAVLALIVGGIIFWRRHQRRKHGGYAAGSQESGCFGRKERSEPPEVLGEEYNAQPYNLYLDQASNANVGPPFVIGATRATSLDSSLANPVSPVPAMSPPPQSGKAGLMRMTNPTQPEDRGDGSADVRSSTNGSSSDGQGTYLRSEVEQLRREMEEMRAKIQNGFEPPPQYT